MPFLFQRPRGPERRAISRTTLRQFLIHVLAVSGLTDASNRPLEFTPHDFRRLFATDALRSGLPPHIAAKILGHADLGTTMGYAAIYSEDVVAHHRAFIARRRALRPGEEYRDLTPEEWDQFLHHFELRKVALGVCTRDFGTPCVHEHSCVRCPQLRPDPAQEPRLLEIRDNLQARIAEARREGWLGEIAGLEATLEAAEQKLQTMHQIAARHGVTHLGMPSLPRHRRPVQHLTATRRGISRQNYFPNKVSDLIRSQSAILITLRIVRIRPRSTHDSNPTSLPVVADQYQPGKFRCPLYDGNDRAGRQDSRSARRSRPSPARTSRPSGPAYVTSKPAASRTWSAPASPAASHLADSRSATLTAAVTSSPGACCGPRGTRSHHILARPGKNPPPVFARSNEKTTPPRQID